MQIFRRRAGIDAQSEKARVGRDDQLRVLTALEGKLRTAVRLIAIVERRVKRVERAFGYAPQAAAAAPPF